MYLLNDKNEEFHLDDSVFYTILECAKIISIVRRYSSECVPLFNCDYSSDLFTKIYWEFLPILGVSLEEYLDCVKRLGEFIGRSTSVDVYEYRYFT